MKGDTIKVKQIVDELVLQKLELFTGKKITYIYCNELHAFLSKGSFRMKGFCQFKFYDKGYVTLLELRPCFSQNKYIGSILGLKIRAQRVKIPMFKKNEERNLFHSQFYRAECSTLEIDGSNELRIKDIIIFGYSIKGEFNEEDFAELPTEKYYEVESVEGVILRFENQKELIITSDGKKEFFLDFKDEIDLSRPEIVSNSVGWKSKIRYQI